MISGSTAVRGRLVVLCAGMLAAAGCKSSAPAAPSVSLGTPTPSSPANGAQISNLSQPVTLTVQNASASSGVTVTYTFEVATDAAFANKVQTKTGITQGSNGQTAVMLDSLFASREYFWHAQANATGATAAFGPMYSFTIGAVATLGAPAAVSPANGATLTGQVQLVVANASKAGPTGTILYRFDVADNLNFNPALFSGTVVEGAGQTAIVPSPALPTGRTLFWRAVPTDVTNGISGLASNSQSFTVVDPTAASLIAQQLGVQLWPAAQPPAFTGSRARLGPGWDVANLVDFTGIPFRSPLIEELRIFDLLDRGLDPDAAINWMKNNGYPTVAVYYPSVLAIGFQPQYMALVNGAWELVRRVGA